jgi:hypothetical protein
LKASHDAKLFLTFDLQGRQGANQEIIRAENKGIAPPSFRTGVGATGHCPRLSKRSGTSKASTGHCLEIGEPRSSSYARASRFSIVRPALPQHPHVTLRLAWEEDREKNPQGYRTAGSASWAMAPEAGCGSAPRAQARREGLRRLGRSEDLGARFSDRGGMASLSVREVLGA